MQCSLCQSQKLNRLQHQRWSGVGHFHCQNCDLIFLDPAARLSVVDEKARYQLHENTLDNSGYVSFLQPTVDHICQLFPEQPMRNQLKLMDFGCGPGPVLAELLRLQGFQVRLYDPYFHPDEAVFAEKYDLIVSTEVFEHLYEPAKELDRLKSCLKSEKAVLLIYTQLHQGPEAFANWWYARDPSHVVFYSTKTCAWIRETWDLENFIVNSARL